MIYKLGHVVHHGKQYVHDIHHKFIHEPSVLTKKMKWEIFERILITIENETVITRYL